MLEYLCIVSFGGIVLWEKTWSAKGLRGDPVTALVKSILVEDRAGEQEFLHENYKVRWALANEAKFAVVAVYQRFLQLYAVDSLLADVRDRFLSEYGSKCVDETTGEQYDFSSAFRPCFAAFQEKEQASEGTQGMGAAADDGEDAAASSSPTTSSPTRGSPTSAQLGGASSIKTTGGRSIGRRGARPDKPSEPKASPKQPAGKPLKKPRTWDDVKPVEDTSGGPVEPTEDDKEKQRQNTRATYIRKNEDGTVARVEEKKWDSLERGKVSTWFRQRFGAGRELDAQDFTTVLPQLKDKLIGKNVAVEIAETVCASVEATLTSKKLGTFDSLPKAIESAMVAALHRILEPRAEVNILRSIELAKERRKPYTVVFCGVNGVGKSTSLAKVTYWLQQQGYSLLLAACDTFRSGAVEQLQVHGDCLGVPVFSQGQSGANTDAAAVCGAALQQASRQGTDVVLVDTAGRMQDHESRMRALAKLIHDNVPDLVLFVGEAIVGNTGIDQLRKFNQCLVDFTPLGKKPRGIDGILLTKFDTIDDKVGAAVSMVYELGQPIVFVGVGQSYQDLKTISAEVVVDMLMKE